MNTFLKFSPSYFSWRIQPEDLKDEDGVALGGKKASILFAHNIRSKAEDDRNQNVENDVTSEVLVDVVRFFLMFFFL
jgi:hypothetical protein